MKQKITTVESKNAHWFAEDCAKLLEDGWTISSTGCCPIDPARYHGNPTQYCAIFIKEVEETVSIVKEYFGEGP